MGTFEFLVKVVNIIPEPSPLATMNKFHNCLIESYLWLIYIATLELYGIRIASSVGFHSCQFLPAGSITVDLIDSMCYQRTMALAIEICSYFNSQKFM